MTDKRYPKDDVLYMLDEAGSDGVCMAEFIDAGLLGFAAEVTDLRIEGVPINSFSCRRTSCSIRSRHISFRIERSF